MRFSQLELNFLAFALTSPLQTSLISGGPATMLWRLVAFKVGLQVPIEVPQLRNGLNFYINNGLVYGRNLFEISSSLRNLLLDLSIGTFEIPLAVLMDCRVACDGGLLGSDCLRDLCGYRSYLK